MPHKKHPTATLATAALSLLLCGTPCVAATDVVQPAVPLGIEESAPNTTEYAYELEGRSDPFIPFITPRAATAPTTSLDPDEIIDEDKMLSGMQLFEPGQLTLVAVLNAESGPMAMVEDVTGKGYILRKGILIGRRGVVSDILPSVVRITETAKTRAGKEIKSTVTMKLKKEGDN